MPGSTIMATDEAAETGLSPESRESRWRRWAHLAGNPGVLAVAVWVLTAPVAFLLPKYAQLNPFGSQATGLVIAAGLLGVAAVTALVLRWPARAWAGVAVALLASWTILAQRTALHGTPFGFGGVQFDAGRITAMATRYTQTWMSSDQWVPGLPSEYPPLYFLVTGRIAAALDRPAWQILPDVAAITVSASVVCAFLLWRRLMPTWVAGAIAATVVLVAANPRKPYESLALAVVIPWVLLTFTRPPRGRLHWLAAGLIGGLMVSLYQAWLVFAGLGIVAIVVINWRAEEDRRSYLRHLIGVALVSAVSASWYLLPYVWTVLTQGSKTIHDKYLFGSLHQGVFPFLDPTPLGALQLVGLAGLIWFRRSTWWATPLLALTVGTLLFRAIATARLVLTGHTSFMAYSGTLVTAILAAAGVCVAFHAARRLVDRFELTPPPGVAAAALALLFAWTTYTIGQAWMPSANTPSKESSQAHLEPLPNGSYSRFAPASDRITWFPVVPVQQAVEGVLGPQPHRVSLSTDERLYAFLPWPGYTTVSPGGAGSLVLWEQRAAEINRLAATSDPAEFARASAQMKFGPIDIFVLRKRDGAWIWRSVAFAPSLFDESNWAVFDDLPEDIVVAVRKN